MMNRKNASIVSPIHNQGVYNQGFTMIEVLIAIFITGVVGTAVFVSHQAQRKASAQVRQMAQMQQQARGVFTIMAEDFRLAGYNRIPETPDDQRLFGILGTSPLTLAYDFDRLSPNTQPSNLYPARCGGPEFTTGDKMRNEPFYSYSIMDQDADDNVTELGRQVFDLACGNRQEVLAENIEAVAFAFAIDNDGDGLLDRGDANGTTTSVIWAADTDGDGQLDTNLDLNGDGQINLDDQASEDTIGTGLPEGGLVSLDKVRAVRIWLLAHGEKDPRYTDTQTYVVGSNIFQAADFGHTNRRHLLVEHIVDCRNMWPPAQL